MVSARAIAARSPRSRSSVIIDMSSDGTARTSTQVGGFVIHSRTTVGASRRQLAGDRLRHEYLTVEAPEKFDVFQQD